MKPCSAHRAAGIAVLAAFLVGACSSTKLPERFHTLLVSERSEPAPASGRVLPIDVLPVTVPAQVDRPEFVVRQADGSLLLLEQDRWAAPLQDELRAALVDRLGARWGTLDVRGVSAVPAVPPWRVRVDVQRFESIPGVEARIEAAWSVASTARGASAPLLCHSVLRESASGASATMLAAAHQRAVQRLADAIGQALQALQAGRTAACA